MRATETIEICKIIEGKLIAGTGKEKIEVVCQDSRLVVENAAFFAVKGANFDGHDYLTSVVSDGASLLIVENEEKFQAFLKKNVQFNGSCILVKNTIDALAKLAKWYLGSLNVKKIGVTGSCGKTSTRDMLYYVCSEKFKTHKNQGNFNTLVGVSLTILDIPVDAQVVIFEMGMDGPGQIREIARLVEPDMAVITNVGVSHLENFNNRDELFYAKMEITEFFKGGEKLIVAGDDLYLNHSRLDIESKQLWDVLVSKEIDKSEEIISDNGASVSNMSDNNTSVNNTSVNNVSLKGLTDISLSNIIENPDMTVSFDIEYDHEKANVKLPVPGKHNAGNASLALAAGKMLGISLEEGAKGLGKMNLTGRRLLVEEGNGFKIINDTYNANPLSMMAAIDILISAEGVENGRKVAVLGDMYELGPDEIKFHREVGQYAMSKIDVLYSVGEMSKVMGGNAHFDTKEELLAQKDQLFKKGDMILVKASNGMKLEKIVEALLESN